MNLQEALDQLGQTSDAIYATLKSCGIKGYPGTFYHCPVANYLNSIFNRLSLSYNAGVGPYEIFVQSAENGFEMVAITPSAIAHFTYLFDSGKKYQDLSEAI